MSVDMRSSLSDQPVNTSATNDPPSPPNHDLLTPTLSSLSIHDIQSTSMHTSAATSPIVLKAFSVAFEIDNNDHKPVAILKRPTSAAPNLPSVKESSHSCTEVEVSQIEGSEQEDRPHAKFGFDEALLGALPTLRDRAFLQKVDNELEQFTLDPNQTRLPIAPPNFPSSLNAYQRLLLHRLADTYGIRREKDLSETRLDGFNPAHITDKNACLVLIKTEYTTIPSVRISELVAAQEKKEASLLKVTTSEPVPVVTIPDIAPTFKIMSREPSKRPSPSSSAASSSYNGEETDKTLKGKSQPPLTFEQRSAAYQEARNRIFNESELNSMSQDLERPSSRTSSSDKSRTSGCGSVLEGSTRAGTSNSSATTVRSGSNSPSIFQQPEHPPEKSVKINIAPSVQSGSPSLRAVAPTFDPPQQYNPFQYPAPAQSMTNFLPAPMDYRREQFHATPVPPHNLYGPYFIDSSTGQMIPFAPSTCPPLQTTIAPPMHYQDPYWDQRGSFGAAVFPATAQPIVSHTQMMAPYPVYLPPRPVEVKNSSTPYLHQPLPPNHLTNGQAMFGTTGYLMRLAGPPTPSHPDVTPPIHHRPASSASVSSSSTSRTASSSNRPGGSSVSGSSSSVSVSGIELLPMRATIRYPPKKISKHETNSGSEKKELPITTLPAVPSLPPKPTWVEQQPVAGKREKRRSPPSNNSASQKDDRLQRLIYSPHPVSLQQQSTHFPCNNLPYNPYMQQTNFDAEPRRAESGRKLWEPRSQ